MDQMTWSPGAPLPEEDTSLRDSIAVPFGRLQLRERVRVLRRLLVPVGPMALLVVAGGAFAKYVRQARSPRMKLAPEDAARLTPAQIVELARYVEQSKPSGVTQVRRFIERASRTVAPSACTSC